MASLGEDLLHTTVRIEGTTPNGSSVGTGFYFMHEERVFLVTNKHVVKDVTNGKFVFLKAEIDNGEKVPVFGEGYTIVFNQSNFIGHPDPEIDISVMNISTILSEFESKKMFVYFKTITEQNIPTSKELETFVSPLEEIVFIGYPSGIWDSKNILPVARKGMTATPYYIDFEGQKKFLIDASVFPGSSGSPVFIYYAGGYPDKKGNFYAGNRINFLGIIAQVYHRVEEGDIKVRNIPTHQQAISETKQMIDLGVVFKAEAVIESINNYVEQATRSAT